MKLQLTPAQSSSFALEAGAYTDLYDASARVVDVFKANDHQPFTRKDVEAVVVDMGCPIDEPFKARDPDTGKLGWQLFYPLIEDKGLVKASRTSYAFGAFTLDAEAPKAAKPLKAEKPKAEKPAPQAPEEEVSWAPLLPEPVPAAPEEGISSAPVVVEEEPPGEIDYYAVDLGLRRLAIAQSNCFGSFKDTSTACGDCPLAPYCGPATMATMADIAADLDKKTEKALAAAATPKAPEPPKAAPAPVYEAPAGPLPEGAKEMETPFDSFCSICRGGIPEGSIGVHLPGSGMVHTHCAVKK